MHSVDGSLMKGQIYDFFVNKSYRLDNLTSISKGGFAGLDARSTLVLLRQSFEITIHNNDQDYASLGGTEVTNNMVTMVSITLNNEYYSGATYDQ
ncbi:hypothetical protein ACTL6P_01125 [Endozoicomonas acroporae]|uniref:hypothetical protein n=1 Tax=Endozoicomonas acroporae TaxID=1701104 RepID=UPI000C77A9B4